MIYKPPGGSLFLFLRIREDWLSPHQRKGQTGARSGLLMGLCHCACHCHCLLQMQIPEWALSVDTEKAAHCSLVLVGNRSSI